jgi:hypothetical protein
MWFLARDADGGDEKQHQARRQLSPDGEHAGSVAGQQRPSPLWAFEYALLESMQCSGAIAAIAGNRRWG